MYTSSSCFHHNCMLLHCTYNPWTPVPIQDQPTDHKRTKTLCSPKTICNTEIRTLSRSLCSDTAYTMYCTSYTTDDGLCRSNSSPTNSCYNPCIAALVMLICSGSKAPRSKVANPHKKSAEDVMCSQVSGKLVLFELLTGCFKSCFFSHCTLAKSVLRTHLTHTTAGLKLPSKRQQKQQQYTFHPDHNTLQQWLH